MGKGQIKIKSALLLTFCLALVLALGSAALFLPITSEPASAGTYYAEFVIGEMWEAGSNSEGTVLGSFNLNSYTTVYTSFYIENTQVWVVNWESDEIIYLPVRWNVSGTVYTCVLDADVYLEFGRFPNKAAVNVQIEWALTDYTVTFNLAGGTRTGGGALTQTVEWGKDATPPTATRAGYVFIGWDKSYSAIKDYVTITALWGYTVTFDLAGGTRTGGGQLTQNIEAGKNATAPAATRAGHTLSGWDKPLTNITGNVTITAQWAINTYTVTFDPVGGSRISGGALVQTVQYNSAAAAPVVERTGYYFTGWDIAFNNITANITVRALWHVNSYTVTFNLAGGTHTGGGALTQTVEHGADAMAPAAARTGYTLSGWSVLLTDITADITITAEWTINTFTVTFNPAGGEHVGGGELTQLVEYGNAAVAPELEREGYTFAGWSVGSDNITGDTVITALWTALEPLPQPPPGSCIVTFDPAGGKRVGSGELIQQIDAGGSAVAPELEREGYTFIGWSAELVGIIGNVTITAEWTINIYTVTFDSCGGSEIIPVTVPHGGKIVLPTPTRSGYEFVGWSGSVPAADWSTDNVTGDVTLSAHWRLIIPLWAKIVLPAAGAGILVMTVAAAFLPARKPQKVKVKRSKR